MPISRKTSLLCLALMLSGCCSLSVPLGACAQETQAAAPPQPDPFDAIPSRLNLTGSQLVAFRAFANIMRKTPARPVLTEDQVRAMSFPDRFDFVAEGIAADLELQRERARATHQFYSALTPDQRQSLDKFFTRPAGRMGVATLGTPLPMLESPDYHLPPSTNPDWLIKPTSDDLQRVYPYRASQHSVSGKAVLACVADEDGYLSDCLVTSETPPDWGFGNAALEISAYMRMKPATHYGVPVRAGVVVPLTFAVPTK